jgi:hypothetical protein
MNHKKCLYSLLVLGLAVATVYATTPLSQPQAQSRPKPIAEAVTEGEFAMTTPQPILSGGLYVMGTGFEAVDGWDLGYSMHGPEFALCPQGSVGTACQTKDYPNHAISQNSCQRDPNEDTGWWANISSRHCNQPFVSDVHPNTGTQHFRQTQETNLAAGACTGTGMGSGCRIRYSAPVDRFPGNTQVVGAKDVWSFEIAFDKNTGNKRIRQMVGWDTANSDLGTYGYNGIGLSGLYFNFNGMVNICKTVACPNSAAGMQFLAYWKYDAPNYGKLTLTIDRCNNVMKYTYQNSPLNAACPGCISEFTIDPGYNLFTPPYGNGNYDYYNRLQDIFQMQHNNVEDTIVDLDDLVVTHTGCPDACCNAAVCTEGSDNQAECELMGGRYYPNTSCATVNANGWCTADKGSCCDAGPGAGGACTDGVFASACTGTQKTWTKGATCNPNGFETLCAIGPGSCTVDNPAFSYCENLPGYVPCTAGGTECDVPGYCYAGLCTQGAFGTCNYTGTATPGFCQTMGRCSGSATCVAATGAGCCDTTCTPPTNCPAGETCIAEPQGCSVIPQGADCALCEGCDAWPAARGDCATVADCPAIPGLTATCEPNPTYVCNATADCPTGTTCIVPAMNPGGFLCSDDNVCKIPAAPACAEHPGACCNSVDGTCTDDVFSANCPAGPQMSWFKLETCVDVEARGDCDAHLGACCDGDAFGGCTETTAAGCTGGKNVWSKLLTCAQIECVHEAIPTVSTWGIAVLTLLLLIGAKVYFGRRQASAA